MPPRTLRTIDPAKVNTVDEWIKAAKRYKNCVLGEDGSLLVLDPTMTSTDYAAALAAPAKTIPHLMGDDYLAILNGTLPSTGELRAAAEAKYIALRSAIKAQRDGAAAAYETAESEVLALADAHESTAERTAKIAIAQQMGAAAVALSERAAALRQVTYPKRYVIEDPTVTRAILVPGSGDDRVAEFLVSRLVNAISDGADRAVRLGDAGAGAGAAY
jgi:hypothetical protein